MNLFNNHNKPIIGMIHLLALPGSPNFNNSITNIFQNALEEAEILVNVGVDALIVENFNDHPYLIDAVDIPSIIVMSNIVSTLVNKFKIPIGVNVLYNAWKTELLIAYYCSANFIRSEVFVDTVISPSGIIFPCAPELVRLQKSIGGQRIEIWADIQTKTTETIIPKDIQQSAIEAEKAGASALIVTGSNTGVATPIEKIGLVKKAVNIPVIAGSGVNKENIINVLKFADGVIVGSSLKANNKAENKVSKTNAENFIKFANQFRKGKA